MMYYISLPSSLFPGRDGGAEVWDAGDERHVHGGRCLPAAGTPTTVGAGRTANISTTTCSLNLIFFIIQSRVYKMIQNRQVRFWVINHLNKIARGSFKMPLKMSFSLQLKAKHASPLGFIFELCMKSSTLLFLFIRQIKPAASCSTGLGRQSGALSV